MGFLLYACIGFLIEYAGFGFGEIFFPAIKDPNGTYYELKRKRLHGNESFHRAIIIGFTIVLLLAWPIVTVVVFARVIRRLFNDRR